MKLVDAQVKLLTLKQPLIRTVDAAVCLNISTPHASKVLGRLAKAGVVFSMARSLWALSKVIDPLGLPEYLTAPLPSYISLQTALYYHGMLSQMSSVTYAVSLGRSRRYDTPLGVISIHHLDTDFFFGYEMVGDKQNIKMATPEKALLDVLYLIPAKSRLFKTLPELEIPESFDVKKAFKMIDKVTSLRYRTIMTDKLTSILK